MRLKQEILFRLESAVFSFSVRQCRNEDYSAPRPPGLPGTMTLGQRVLRLGHMIDPLATYIVAAFASGGVAQPARHRRGVTVMP